MQRKKIGAAVFISLLLSACSSMPHGQTSPTVKPDISHVSYSGAGDFSQKVKFYGVDTTLTVALNNIIPDDWKYTVSSDINLNEKTVSWESDQAWIYTLGGVMQYYGVYARLDFVNKRAEISRKPIVKPVPVVKNSTDKTTVSKVNKNNDTSLKSATGMTVPVAPAISVTSAPTVTKPIVKPLPIWIASPTFTLQENMTAWANKEGWVVVWNTQVDYPIQVEFRIQDTFLNLVKKTIELYQKADKPLYAEAIPAQRLIVITSK